MAGGKKQPNTPESSDLASVLQRKSKVVESITRIRQSIINKTISFNPFEIECRLDILKDYIAQAMDNQSELDVLDPSNDERSELENLCISTKSLLLSLQAKNRTSNVPDISFMPAHHSRLPNMRLPKFSGKYSDYKNFMSLFENLVHGDATLTDIEKFNHLISCLSDEALGTVKAFQISEDNYPKALASLKKVYDNECLIFFDNISKLFDLPEITKPSASSLRSMIDTVSAIYDSLLSIGDDKKITNAILIHLVISKVDPVTKSKWEEQLDFEHLPLWSDCEAVLNKRYQHIAADESSGSRLKTSRNKSDNPPKKSPRTSLSCTTRSKQSSEKCLFCKSAKHNIYNCSSFAGETVQQRFEFIKSIPACINCLKRGHTVSRCNHKKCGICGGSHNNLLHRFTHESQVSPNTPHFPKAPEYAHTSQASINMSASEESVILATALVKVKTNSGKLVLARALLDSGSQANLITEELAQRLRLKRDRTNLSLSGVGKTSSVAKSSVDVTMMSRINGTQFNSRFWVLNSITSFQPDRKVSITDWNIPKNIELADPYFYKPQKVDLLIGSEIFFELLCVGQIKSSPSLPMLQKTSLGWIVAGKYNNSTGSIRNVFHLTGAIENEDYIDSVVRKFWELEELPRDLMPYNEEQRECEEKFKMSVRRLTTGRFTVSLPFKKDPAILGSSFDVAKRRFLALERKLSKDTTMKKMYHDFMKEYIDLGHMSATDNRIPHFTHYFIPHQCVLRLQSTTTKLRVVFDASSKTTSQVSLNDLLMVGPTIQEELFSILIRFRLHKFVITADIEKMYRQFLIDEADRDFQLILYRENPTESVKIFRLNTVTYGTSSAPFLAIRCLLHLGDIYQNNFPVGAKIIRRDFYVDDLLTGADNLNDLLVIREQVTKILGSAGLKLAKWFSNYSADEKSEYPEKFLQNDADTSKALGIRWTPKSDSFTFHLDDTFSNLRATKRNILSISARLFDPLGLICPIVTKSKILLQELWLHKLDWDESIPMRLDSAWENFKLNLTKIDSISIPRFVQTTLKSKLQIHGFSDASIRAYGCCIYVRSVTSDKISCRLLTAKSRVAPLKTKSLPRLELCAAHLLAKLWTKIQDKIEFEIDSINFWSDSEITLHWIRTHPSLLNTFVSNRVADIQECSERVVWRHVPTKQNPADIVSRGSDVDELKNSIWFEGPLFLLKDNTEWPKTKILQISPDQDLLEKRKSTALISLTKKDEGGSESKSSNVFLNLLENYSTYNKLLNVISFVIRFVDATKKLKIERSIVPTAKELNRAFLRVVEIIQKNHYHDERLKIQKSQILSSTFQRLTPFIHDFSDEGRSFSLIRVGGRLLNSQLPYNTKFPLLLPKRLHFVELFLRHIHITNCHAGAKAMTSILRERVWLINAKEECRRVVRNCVHCFRYKPKLMSQVMGNLPADRLRVMRPFLVVGVDFCGPVNVSLRIRGRPPVKMYISVFVCFSSKAIHLELVSDLSANAFILCLKRFAARRGLPKKIHCDNATNFVGANRELQELQKAFERQRDDLVSFAATTGIEFSFIPPRAPHFGGLWEAAVKQAKFLLLRAVGNASLNAEEMTTMLTEVEAVLNSRPIAPLSADPNDSEALTPAHLLIGGGLRSLPPGSDDDVKGSALKSWKRWRLLSGLKEMFWQSWSREYVLGLQDKSKWHQETPNLQIGKLVLIHEDNLPPQEWITGRVVAVTEGKDGKVRVAEIRTKNGIFKRPIQKLAVLPID